MESSVALLLGAVLLLREAVGSVLVWLHCQKNTHQSILLGYNVKKAWSHRL